MFHRITLFACLCCLAVGGCSKPELNELKAKRGDADAQYDLGMHYAKNECCSPVPAIDPKEGAKWYLKSAKQGHVAAQLEFADLYFAGKGGLSKMRKKE